MRICFAFGVLRYLADRKVIIIPPFTQFNIPEVSQGTFKTKGQISIEGTFFWDTLYKSSRVSLNNGRE